MSNLQYRLPPDDAEQTWHKAPLTERHLNPNQVQENNASLPNHLQFIMAMPKTIFAPAENLADPCRFFAGISQLRG